MPQSLPHWNWQQPHWPEFQYDPTLFADCENHFLLGAGVVLETVTHLEGMAKDQLTIDLVSQEAFQTSAIEGEILSRDSLQASLRRQFGLQTDEGRRVPAAEQGIAQMLVDLYHQFNQPMTHEQLFNWHRMLTHGRRDLQILGGYRSHQEPMQVVSSVMSKPRVHFEAPPSTRMPQEMGRFIEWFNATAPGQSTALSCLARAGIAHLYFVCVHPFEDGNGRIGRAISDKALSQALGRPSLVGLSDGIERRRKGYYDALESNNKGLDITDWLLWFAETTVFAQTLTLNRIGFLVEKGKLYSRLRGQLNERQQRVLERMFLEGVDGFKGGLSAENYIRITQASRATTTRDLQDLVEKGALLRTGERKSTRYQLNLPMLVSTLSGG